jgi:20S proteasome subunit beta 7
MSDYQALQHMLDSITVKQSQLEDGHQLRTSQIFEYLGRVMYNRRSKMDPLWNSLLVAGWETSKLSSDGGKPYVYLLTLMLAVLTIPVLQLPGLRRFAGHHLFRAQYRNWLW